MALPNSDSHFSPWGRMPQAENWGVCRAPMYQVPCFLLSLFSVLYCSGTQIKFMITRIGPKQWEYIYIVNSQYSTKIHHKPILTARDQHVSSKSRHGGDAKILKHMSKQDST